MPPANRAKAIPAEPAADAAGENRAALPALRALKKHPNRRLDDTRSSSCNTLSDVKQRVPDGEHFEVRDAKAAEILTRIIRCHDHAMQGLMNSGVEQGKAIVRQMLVASALFPVVPGFNVKR